MNFQEPPVQFLNHHQSGAAHFGAGFGAAEGHSHLTAQKSSNILISLVSRTFSKILVSILRVFLCRLH